MLRPTASASASVAGATAAWVAVLLLVHELAYLFQPLETLSTASHS